jgi:hypothetical protein
LPRVDARATPTAAGFICFSVVDLKALSAVSSIMIIEDYVEIARQLRTLNPGALPHSEPAPDCLLHSDRNSTFRNCRRQCGAAGSRRRPYL